MERLTCSLHTPGMGPFHRAGLGGLASTLHWLPEVADSGDRPDGSWAIDATSVTLEWAEGQANRKTFFEALFSFAFQLRDGLIYLPGQYGGSLEPPVEVRAAIHDGLLLSYYDHGPTSRKAMSPRELRYEIDDKTITIRCLPLQSYKHRQSGAEDMQSSFKGGLALTRAYLPGAIQRHAAIGASHAVVPPTLALPILFAPISSIALRAGGKRVNDRGKRKLKPGAAVLLVDFGDLTEAPDILPAVIPRNVSECQVSSPADVALQAELRLRSRALLDPRAVPSVRCVWCCANDWNSRLQPPSDIVVADTREDDPRLDLYELAMRELEPPRPRQTKDGRWFWPSSHIRPLIAKNLLAGRRWYAGFANLMSSIDPESRKPVRDVVQYHERKKELQTMTELVSWESKGEVVLIRAVHAALGQRYGAIADENRSNPVAMKKRWAREYERQRLAFSGAKTPAALRHALAELWSRGGSNRVLRDAWYEVLPLLAEDSWELARDLALLGLASYAGKGAGQLEEISTEIEEETP